MSENIGKQAGALLQSGNYIAAEPLYRQLTGMRPQDADAWRGLGVCLGMRGLHAEAVLAFRRSVDLQPGHPGGHFTLAVACAQTGDTQQAVAEYTQALKLNPRLVQAHHNLGFLLLESGQAEQAANHLYAAARLQPGNVATCLNLGNVLLSLNRLEEAGAWYRQALKLNPKQWEAHYNIGNLLNISGQLPAAKASLIRARDLQPDNVKIRNNLGKILDALGEMDAARQELETAIACRPDEANLYATLSGILTGMERFEEAEDCVSRGLLACPDTPLDLVAAHSSILESQGRFDKAYQIISDSVDKGAKGFKTATAFASLARRFHREDKALELLREAVNEPQMASSEKSQALFALGKLYDSLGQYDQAFDTYRQANQLKFVTYDGQADRQQFTAIQETFTTERYAALPRSGNASSRPLFIVGMPRSGTTLLEQILDSHPEVAACGEQPLIMEFISDLPGLLSGSGQRTYPFCLEDLSREVLNGMADEYLARLEAIAGSPATHFVDKMPHNFMHLGLISLIFPGARIIHCTRDPRDTALSIYFQDFKQAHLYAYDLEHIGQHYSYYRDLMEHWIGMIDNPILEMNYERLVQDQEKETRRVLEFLGLSWHDDCLQFFQNRRYAKTASYDQVRQPIYQRSVARWQHYEAQLLPLMKALEL